jgi:hypothetical protein
VVKEYSRKNILKYILEVLIKYNIIKNLGYFIINNILNNNIIIILLSLTLQRDFKLNYNPIYYYIYYQGHIINLVIKSFLFIIDKETLNKDKETSIYIIIIV